MAKDDYFEIEKVETDALDKPTAFDFLTEINQKIPEYMKSSYDEAIKKLQEARDPNISPAEVGKRYLEINGILQELLLKESVQPKQSPLRSLNIARAAKSMEVTSRMAVQQAQLTQNSEVINPNGPKFQMIIRWLLEAFDEALEEAKIDVATKNLVIALLSKSLKDFETKIEKSLRGASFEALKKIRNPFIESIMDEISINGKNNKDSSAE